MWEFAHPFRPDLAKPLEGVVWIDTKGNLADSQTEAANVCTPDMVYRGEALGKLHSLRLRDASHFVAGSFHNHVNNWVTRLGSDFPEVVDWIKNRVNVERYFVRYTGVHKRHRLDCDKPPPIILPNSPVCQEFSEFVTTTLLDRLKSGALGVWGKVGEVNPPTLVLPLTIEPKKSRAFATTRGI